MKVSTGARIASMRQQNEELRAQLKNWQRHADDQVAVYVQMRGAFVDLSTKCRDIGGSFSPREFSVCIDEILNKGAFNPVFTQRHYIAVAKLIKDERLKTNLKYPMGSLGNNTDYTIAYETAMQTISELQLAFMKHFKLDNAKFEELLFIGACGDINDSQR